METIAVRPDERFDVEGVARYLREHLPDFPSGPLSVEQFPTGHSNLTFLLRAGDFRAVLRRPPLGPVAPKAHDMERESRVLALLHPRFPLAPRPLVFCGDPAVLGAPFYVMEYRPGGVLDAEWPAGWPTDEGLRRRITEALVDTLVALHAVDWHAAGLGELSRPEGYLKRQVDGWIQRWQRAQTHPVEGVEATCRWLVERLPESPSPTVVHNDFKLNNLKLDPADPAKVTAVLDWEMATVGDPLTDVGALLSYWIEPGDTLSAVLPSVTALPGFPNRREVLELYGRRSGRDVSGIGWYLAFAYFKLAVILQQIYFRWHNGQTKDERFRHHGELAEGMLRQAAAAAKAGRL